ncbi:MAG: hypothetical protein IPP33_09925 [Flavobacteriales bacterium]|nr:hypothetical protein [Flavobacteriales bacterium]
MKRYLQHPIAQIGMVRIFDLRGTPEVLTEDTIFQQGQSEPFPLQHRFDTVACTNSGSTWCFGSNEYPIDINGIQQNAGRALRVRGNVHWNAPPRNNAELVFAEDDDQKQISIHGQALSEGQFDLRFALVDRPTNVRNKLFLWNRSGSNFTLDGLRLTVVHSQDRTIDSTAGSAH